MTKTEKNHESLVAALVSFQSDLPAVDLDSHNPHFKSKFASLANITRKVLPKLAENGLAFSVGSRVENGLLILDARLLHSPSGETISAQFPITETNPQKVGSAVTYYRRYALSSLTGIVADEDDDGNVASEPAPPALAKAQAAKAKPAPKSAPATPATAGNSTAIIKSEFIETELKTTDDIKTLAAKIKSEKSLTGEPLYAEVLRVLRAEKGTGK